MMTLRSKIHLVPLRRPGNGSTFARRVASLFLFLCLAAPIVLRAQTYDLGGEFAAANPNGVWSYGWKNQVTGPLGGSLSSYFQTEGYNGVPLIGWVYEYYFPAVYGNISGETALLEEIDGEPDAVVPSGTVFFSPGYSSNGRDYGVIRFTAPANGTYQIDTTVAPLYHTYFSDADFHLVKNGTELLSWSIDYHWQTFSDSRRVSLVQGETIDFVVGRGADGIEWKSDLKIAATLTLIADGLSPGELHFVAPNLSVSENATFLRVYVSRQGGMAGPASVRYATVANGSATPMADFVTTSAFLNWEDGDQGDKYFDVFLGHDSTVEGNETFGVTLSEVSGAALGSPSSATVTIIDAPPSPGTIQFSQVSYSVSEAGPSVSISVSRSGGSAGAASVTYTTGNSSALAGSDYITTSSTMSWANLESGPKTFTVPIVNDTIIESAESFWVTLTGSSGAPLGSLTSASVTIVDNDSDSNVYDLSQNLGPNPNGAWSYGWKETFGGPFSQLMVRETPDPHADNGVPVMAWERVLQNYPAVFGNPTANNAVAGGGQAQLPPGTVWFLAGSANPYNYGVVRFTAPNAGTYALWTLVEPVYNGSYQGDTDFHIVRNGAELSGTGWLLGTTQSKSHETTLTLAANDTMDFMIGRGADNNLWGSTMKIKARMTFQPSPGTLQFKSGTYSVAENGGSVRIFVSRTGGSGGAASVSYSTAGVTAIAGADYTAAGGTLNWANGDASDKFFDVPISNDNTPENHETFIVNLSGPSVATLGSPSATTVTILNGIGVYDPTDTTDSDSDGLTDSGEIYLFDSNPLNAFSRNERANGHRKNIDSVWLFGAMAGDPTGDSQATLTFGIVNSSTFKVTLSGVPADAWDIYFKDEIAGTVMPWTLFIQGTPGQTIFEFPNPGGTSGFFAAGKASDMDADGLTDGYEALVSHTRIDVPDYDLVDTDGDGLSDHYELTVTHTDPTNPDTGDTGVSDGYKDTDGDGWTNIDEKRNGSNPVQFNTPAAPGNVTVHFTSGATTVRITWNPASGPVTGYKIRRNGTEIGTVSASTLFLDDAADSTTGDPNYIQKRYDIQALYGASGASGFSSQATIWKPELAISGAWLVRGPSEQKFLCIGGLPQNASAIRVTQYNPDTFSWDYVEYDKAGFPNGIRPMTGSTILGLAWVQAVGIDSALGQPRVLSVALEDFPDFANNTFVDLRQVLSDNLRFLLRGATVSQPFSYAAFETSPSNPFMRFPIWDRSAISDQYEYSSYHWHYADPDPAFSYTAFDPVRPLEENFLWRNFVFNPSLFAANGDFLTGAHPAGDFWEASREIIDPMFKYDGGSATSQLLVNQTGSIFYTDVNGDWSRCFDPDNNLLDPCPNSTLIEAGMIEQLAWPHLFWTISGSAKNVFGLPIDSAQLRIRRNPIEFPLVTAAQSADVISYGARIFLNVQQPVLQTVGYYFSYRATDPMTGNSYFSPPIPGEPSFSPANTTPLLVTSVGQPLYVSGWAKKRIVNGDPNKFAYLEQFFDRAYKADVNGNATTEETGLLSEYGEFFPSEPGRVILKTKADIETGGVGQALVNVISLDVDANHDGTMDRTFAGPDKTSAQRPFRFWINNDRDDGVEVPLGGVNGDDRIKSRRDLEDFARLWISGIPSLPAAEGYTVTLSWQNVSGTPTIKLYNAYETDGGVGYLTSSSLAAEQIKAELVLGNFWTGHGAAVAAISPSTPYQFPLTTFADGLRKHFIFQAAAPGVGTLVLTIAKNGTTIASTSAHFELLDVENFYEEAFISGIKLTHPAMRDNLGASTFSITRRVAGEADEKKQMIVYVHGWNNDYAQFHSYADTFFKRLYWQGYRGRFAGLKWPTLTGLPTYNRSEYIAFRSAAGAAGYFTDLRSRFPDYSINVAAHSMGNMVMMETLKLHLAQGRQDIDNYVLMEGAVPAQCYWENAPLYQVFLEAEIDRPTPNTYQTYPGAIQNALRDGMANFFNEDDSATSTSWNANQWGYKPDGSLGYVVVGGTPYLTRIGSSDAVNDPRERMAFVARSRTRAIGTQQGAAGVILKPEFNLKNELGFGRALGDHSGQFTRNNQSVRLFYAILLQRFGLVL